MSFTEPATGELHITLHDPQPQTALQDILDARPGMDIVRSIIPLNVEGQDYYVSMAPLSEEKTIEKIKQDLVTEFKPELDAGKRGAGGRPLTSTRRRRRTGPPTWRRAGSSSSWR